MRTWALASVVVLLFFGIFASANAQLADNVVINEVDINPSGDDAKAVSEWVELFNPTDEIVDLGGWKIASTSVTKKTLTLSPGAKIKPGEYLLLSYTTLWFPDVNEKVQLRDNFGNVIDETPPLTDKQNDFFSWQRKYDGIDTNSANDWIFRMSSAGSTNGRLPDVRGGFGELAINVKTDKNSYLFDDTAIISGNVTKRVYQEKPYFSQEQVTIHISGPGGFNKLVTLYPDRNLEFKTDLKLSKVLGVIGGTYSVTVSYDVVQDKTVFAVGDKTQVTVEQQEADLTISTDKTAYLPGQVVKISGRTSDVIPLEGLEYKVINPDRMLIFSGNLYPTPRGEFSGQVFMTTVKPVFGTFTIKANYGNQHAETTFELVNDLKDAQNIILRTDKQAYGLGETVIISGKSNRFVPALDLEVLQTGTTAIGKETTNVFRIKDQVKLAGDSSFEYKLQMPSDAKRLGDYRVTVSKEFGKAETFFKIVEDPEQYIVSEKKMFVSTDKANYDAGEIMIITGHVIPKTRSTFQAIPVHITLQDESGKALTIVGLDKKLKLRDDSLITAYTLTAIPDAVGNYRVETVLNRAFFPPGTYIVEASYDKSITSTLFSVSGGLDTRDTSINAKLDKSVYGLGETVNLQGTWHSGQSAVKIVLTKPDGKTVNSGAKVDNNKFSWSWTIPKSDFATADIRDPRAPRPTVFGTYKITLSGTSQTTDLFFKVSANPEAETLEIKPLDVRTEKAVYTAGEKLVVEGNAIKRTQKSVITGGIIPDRVTIQVKHMNNKQILEANAPFDNAGNFRATFDLPLTVFKDGTYKVVAIHQKLRADTTFEVRNNLPLDGDGELAIRVTTDKEEYSPGETIGISGSLNKIVSLQNIQLTIIPDEKTKSDCGTLYCGLSGDKIDLNRYYNNGIYNYNYKLPSNVGLGTYIIQIDTAFGTFTNTFKVVEKKEPVKIEPKPLGKISDKFNRITDSLIDIPLFEQNVEDQLVAPSLLSGSLFSSRGSEASVNLLIMADDGSCVIGQEEGCLISSSTKETQNGYEIVTFAGLDYKVSYSGPEQFLETFSIEPVDGIIPNSIWSVEVVKENQPSRFYYEVTYKPIQ